VTPAPQWLSDMLQGAGRDKEHHEWGQDESEVSYLVRHLTEPGDLVVDPFCGGGTIPVVCKELGRRWLATEIDKGTALVARKRVAES
jgi:tRNA/tmRNA/rRNA uracil-C5-methylase (TrmA/RlmC/RlmD family)